MRSDVSSWLEWVLSASNVHGGLNDDMLSLLSYVTFTCWHIWKARCNLLYNNSQLNPTQIICAISNSAGAFFDVVRRNQELPVLRTEAIQASRYATPPTQFTKINVNASWYALTSAGFIGIVLRDVVGSFVAAIRHAITTPCVGAAEVVAISKGCEFGLALGIHKIIVKSDSQESICSFSDSLGIGRWEAFPSLVKAKRLGESFQDCRWSWIPSCGLAGVAAMHRDVRCFMGQSTPIFASFCASNE